jgi:hypothetical protein
MFGLSFLAESVELQLKNPVGMIKRARAANKPHGFNPQKHELIIQIAVRCFDVRNG